MPKGSTFEDDCPSTPQRRSEPEWPDIEAIDKRDRFHDDRRQWVLLTRKEWRQIKSLLERVK